MKKSYIHIGLAKTGTTSFQKNVLPLICKELSINHHRQSKELTEFLSQHKANMRFNHKIEKSPDLENYFISMESLSNSRDPYKWLECARMNYQAFGKDNHILLVLRKPRDYLNSIYLEVCIHEGYFKNVKDFFLKKIDYRKKKFGYKFSIEDFSYTKLILEYRKYFNKVTYVKFESFGKFNFLDNLFNISSDKKNKFNIAFNKNIQNISYNYSSVFITKLFYFVTKILFSLFNNFIFKNLIKYIAKIYLKNLKKNESIKKQAIEKLNNNYVNFEQVFHHLLKVIKWDKCIFFISKFLPSKKYKIKIKDNEIQNLIEKYEIEYDNLKDFETFIK